MPQSPGHALARRVWAARGFKPHLVETFELSNDPRFEEKLIDVVGCISTRRTRRSCCAAMRSPRWGPRSHAGVVPDGQGAGGHDDPRLQTPRHHHAVRRAGRLTGKVIGDCLPRHRHRHEEFLRFLRTIEPETPQGLDVHLICDNYATHKHAKVTAWLDKRPRFHMHFTPTSSSWLNLVERWFRELTDKAPRRGVFHSVPDLIAAIEDYLTTHNANPKPFVWTATAEDILAKSPEAASRCKLSTNDETHH